MSSAYWVVSTHVWVKYRQTQPLVYFKNTILLFFFNCLLFCHVTSGLFACFGLVLLFKMFLTLIKFNCGNIFVIPAVGHFSGYLIFTLQLILSGLLVRYLYIFHSRLCISLRFHDRLWCLMCKLYLLQVPVQETDYC